MPSWGHFQLSGIARDTTKSNFSVAYAHRGHALPLLIFHKSSFELKYQSSNLQISNMTQLQSPASSACHPLAIPTGAVPVRDMCSRPTLPKEKTDPEQNVKKWQFTHSVICSLLWNTLEYFGITGNTQEIHQPAAQFNECNHFFKC